MNDQRNEQGKDLRDRFRLVDGEGAQHGRWLVARFAEPHLTASWAIVGGGIGLREAVAWYHVKPGDLPPEVDAVRFLEARLAERPELGASAGVVGLLTGRRLDRYAVVSHRSDERGAPVEAMAVATVGLGNALRAGNPLTPAASAVRVGTINVLAQVSVALSENALLEALGLVAEARTAAVLASGVRSFVSGEPASGTGTDCFVVAAPAAGEGRVAEAYAGKHTAVGAVLGRAVYDAVLEGARVWLDENREVPAVEGLAAVFERLGR